MSKLARVLVLGAMLAAMNLAGMTAVAKPKPTTKARTSGGRPPKAKWERPGASVRSHHSRPPWMPLSGGCWPGNAPQSPTGRPPRCPPRCGLANRADSPGWLVLGIAVTAALALVAGLAVGSPPYRQPLAEVAPGWSNTW